jgi:hypothetical protein
MGNDQRKKNAIPTMVAGRKTVYGPHSGNPETIPKRVRRNPGATSVLEHHFLERGLDVRVRCKSGSRDSGWKSSDERLKGEPPDGIERLAFGSQQINKQLREESRP